MNDEPRVEVVYFLVDEPMSAVKIGRTVDTVRRLRELQVGGTSKLKYLGWIPGGSEQEGALHRVMAEHRIRGEWFRLTPAVRVLIEGACAAHRQKLDADEASDLVRALEATHEIVCRGKGCSVDNSSTRSDT